MGRVRIVDHDARWAEAFVMERDLLARALGTAALEIQHIGSTAVAKLAATPIVDILIGVRSVPLDAAAVTTICALGYVHGSAQAIAGRHDFSRADRHVHLVEHGSASWIDHLLFRDFLRVNDEVAAEYEGLKRELARRLDRREYAEAKAPFIVDVIARARARLAGTS